MNSSKKQKIVALFFKFLGTFLGMNKGSADGNPQPLIEYFQKNHQIMQFDTENHMKKLLTCGILHYMIDVKELAYEILVHFRYLHCRVINERVQDRKNYSEISALLQFERGSNGYSMFFPFFFILIKSERFQNIFFLSICIFASTQFKLLAHPVFFYFQTICDLHWMHFSKSLFSWTKFEIWRVRKWSLIVCLMP